MHFLWKRFVQNTLTPFQSCTKIGLRPFWTSRWRRGWSGERRRWQGRQRLIDTGYRLQMVTDSFSFQEFNSWALQFENNKPHHHLKKKHGKLELAHWHRRSHFPCVLFPRHCNWLLKSPSSLFLQREALSVIWWRSPLLGGLGRISFVRTCTCV